MVVGTRWPAHLRILNDRLQGVNWKSAVSPIPHCSTSGERKRLVLCRGCRKLSWSPGCLLILYFTQAIIVMPPIWILLCRLEFFTYIPLVTRQQEGHCSRHLLTSSSMCRMTLCLSCVHNLMLAVAATLLNWLHVPVVWSWTGYWTSLYISFLMTKD